jgi:peptidyl-prolyl cis-trans isomerase SurA
VKTSEALNLRGRTRVGRKAGRKATLGGLCLLMVIVGCTKPPSPDVAATVNGKPILKSSVEKYYKSNLGDSQQSPTPEQAGIQRLSVLRSLIDEEILQQRADKLNLAASDEEVDAKLAEMKAPFTAEEFDARLKANGVTLDDVKKQLKRTLTIQKLFNKEINAKINITDADIANYYNQNKASYNLVEPEDHLAQIVVMGAAAPPQTNSNLATAKTNSDADAKKKIEMLHQQLESGGDFGALAMNYSEAPATASNGGDMGFIPESQLKTDPTVFGALTKLKPGQFTDVIAIYENPNSPVKKAAGYVIYQLLAREPAGQRQLTDPRVQQDIRQRLRESRSQLLKNAYYEILRDQAKIDNYMAADIFKQASQ